MVESQIQIASLCPSVARCCAPSDSVTGDGGSVRRIAHISHFEKESVLLLDKEKQGRVFLLLHHQLISKTAQMDNCSHELCMQSLHDHCLSSEMAVCEAPVS